MDLFLELEAILAALRAHQVPYALCGGFALSVYGIVRATEDVDLLVPPEALPAFRAAARGLGFARENDPMELAAGRVRISRFLKFGGGGEDVVVMDVLHVTSVLEAVWSDRQTIPTAGFGEVVVVSREGLIRMKKLRSSALDLADIAQLEAGL